MGNLYFSFAETGKFLIDVKDFDETFLPYLAKRVLQEKQGFYDKRLPLMKIEEGIYELNFNTVCNNLELSVPYTFDIVMYRAPDNKISFVSFDDDVCLADMSGEVCIDNCKVKYDVYKSANGRIFIKAILVPTIQFEMKILSETDNSFDLLLNMPKEGDAIPMLCRRSVKERNRSYNSCVNLEYNKISETQLKINLPKNWISDYVQAPAEIWDFLVKFNNRNYDCFIKGCFESEYFETNDSFLAKLFSSEGKYAGIWTKEGANRKYKKIKVAIIGSCFSKEAFHSVDHCNPDYKRFYSNGFLCWHQSFISLMSPPLEYDPSKLDDPKSQRECELYGQACFMKTDVQKLKEYKPDYLVIDTYVESAACVFETIDGGCITDSYYLMNTTALREMEKKYIYHPSHEVRFEKFKESFDKFLREIADVIPNDRIVLVRAHPALKKINNGRLEFWEERDGIEYQSKLWEKNDDWVISRIPRIRIIDMRFGNYYSDRVPHLSFSRNHMNSEYYKDMLYQFHKIVLQDILKHGYDNSNRGEG